MTEVSWDVHSTGEGSRRAPHDRLLGVETALLVDGEFVLEHLLDKVHLELSEHHRELPVAVSSIRRRGCSAD